MNLASLAEQNLAEYGEYDRLVFEGKTFTNRELHEASLRLAGALAGLGCAPGDKVVLMMPNGPEVLVSYPAIWRAGLVVIPVLFVLEDFMRTADVREGEYGLMLAMGPGFGSELVLLQW